MHRFVRISGNACFAIFHSAMAEKHLFTKRMKNETTAIICIAAKRPGCLSRGNIAFYMFLPAKIDHAPVRHGDQDHITMVCARAVISASTRNRICEANETPSFQRIAKIRCEKRTLSPGAASALQVSLLRGQCPLHFEYFIFL